MEACRLTATNIACRRGERLLFAGLSLALESGEALQIAGPNGMGKSSLIRILAGLLRPYEGAVTREGMVALLDEKPALDEYLPLGTALDFWSGIDGGSDLAREGVIERVGLADLLDVPVRYLSTGQRKRAAIARMTSQRAPIWLLDEPLNGLDRDAVAMTEQLVGDHCRAGGIAVIASHQAFDLRTMQTMQLAEFTQ